jgi:hypothetical protein
MVNRVCIEYCVKFKKLTNSNNYTIFTRVKLDDDSIIKILLTVEATVRFNREKCCVSAQKEMTNKIHTL